MNKFLSFLFALIFAIPLYGTINLLPREHVISLKTSVLIPMHYKHFSLLQEIITCYAQQTVLPNEVVVSISECNKLPANAIETIENHQWPFSLKIIKNTEKCSAGNNRNIAFASSTGDLILCNDADDPPHPQRVEIVKYLFENFDIDLLLHGFTQIHSPNDNQGFSTIPLENLESFYHTSYGIAPGANGANCYLRRVGEKFKWPDQFGIGEDVKFNEMIYRDSNFKKAVLRNSLYLWRTCYSSHNS